MNGGFYLANGPQRYNRALYGAAQGGSRFSVFAGDIPEWMLYHAGGAGYAFLGIAQGESFIPLSSYAAYDIWYSGGMAVNHAEDPAWGRLTIEALPDAAHAAALLHVKAENLPEGAQLCLVYGGIDRMGDSRNLDAGYTEQARTLFSPARTKNNLVILEESTASVQFEDMTASLDASCPCTPMAVDPEAFLQGNLAASCGQDTMAALLLPAGQAECILRISLEAAVLPPAQAWAAALLHADSLRTRAECISDDPALDAAAACLPAALEGMWLAPYYLHGAWSWRIPLLGWRSRFGPSIMGWGDRVQQEARTYFSMMYEAGKPIRRDDKQQFNQDYFVHGSQEKVLYAADEGASGAPDPRYRMARQSSRSVFNTDGAMPYGPGNEGVVQYDMQQDFITQAVYQLNCGCDRAFAEEVFPRLKRHLAWQERCFHRDGLYESFANFWASDAIQYFGGGCALATANNYLAYDAAARLADLLGEDASPFLVKKEAISRAFHEQLWLPRQGSPAEFRDGMGQRLVHPMTSLPTIVTCITSGILTEDECLRSLDYVRRELEHISLPDGALVYNTQWAPYHWSVRDVDFADMCHLALCCFLLGRAEDGWHYLRGVIGESCMRSVAPGAFMCVLEGKSVDFSDTASIAARALAEGLFGYRPRLLKGHILLAPAIPEALPRLKWKIPGAQGEWRRTADTLAFTWQVENQDVPLRLQLPLHRARLDRVCLNGKDAADYQIIRKGDRCFLEMTLDALSGTAELSLSGEYTPDRLHPIAAPQKETALPAPAAPAAWTPLNMDAAFNSCVGDLFSKPYLSPRPDTCSLQAPWTLLPADWCLRPSAPGAPEYPFRLTDDALRSAVHGGVFEACGVPFRQAAEAGTNNALFVSQWDNYPNWAEFPLEAPAGWLALLLTGCTNQMQCGVTNARLHFTHPDGTETCLALTAPINFRSIESGPDNERPQDRSCYQADLPRAVIGRFTGEIHGPAWAQVNYMHVPKPVCAVRVEAVANEIVLGLLGVSAMQADV